MIENLKGVAVIAWILLGIPALIVFGVPAVAHWASPTFVSGLAAGGLIPILIRLWWEWMTRK